MEETKICTKCGKEKPLSEFYFRKDTQKYRNKCQECRLSQGRKYYSMHSEQILNNVKSYKEAHPWKIVLQRIIRRCTNKNGHNYKYYGGRGIKCLITEEELKKLWFRDKAYLLKKPSIDRIDNDGHYEYNNCQFIEQNENSKKANNKITVQYDLNGNFIKEWKSGLEASKVLNLSYKAINNALRRKSHISQGFIWRYKNV